MVVFCLCEKKMETCAYIHLDEILSDGSALYFIINTVINAFFAEAKQTSNDTYIYTHLDAYAKFIGDRDDVVAIITVL